MGLSCRLSLVGSMRHTAIECKMRSEWWEDGKEWKNGELCGHRLPQQRFWYS